MAAHRRPHWWKRLLPWTKPEPPVDHIGRIGPATVYTSQVGGYAPGWNAPTAAHRPLMTPGQEHRSNGGHWQHRATM